MASENETVEDIANEMRGEWAQVYFSEGSRRKDGEYCDNEFAAIEPEAVADRIESAWRREVAELRECLREILDKHLCRGCVQLQDRTNDCYTVLTGDPCIHRRWRKVLEATKGAEDEGN